MLAEHALRLTPPDSAARSERLLELARYLEVAGERQRLTDLLAPELDSLPPGEPRVRAYLLLAAGAVSDNDEIQRYLVEALAAGARDPALRAQVLVQISENEAVIRVQAIADAEAVGARGARGARATRDIERRALYALALGASARGRPIDDLCARFRAASDAAVLHRHLARARRGPAARVARRRRAARATVLTDLLALADERGESYSYVLLRLHLCELELRVGDCAAAARVLDEWAESSEDDALADVRALPRAARRGPRPSRRGEALGGRRRSPPREATGTRWDLLEARRALGVAALLAHEPAEAAESLRAVWEHTRREGVDEPGVFPVAPELVEALVELGALDEAREVAGRLRELGEQQQHPWALVTADKADALVRLASPTYDEQAAAALESAAAAYGELGLRFDRARTLLDLGRAQRRFKKWGPAREALEQAAAAFDELGADGWAEEARSELARVGARRPRADRRADADGAPGRRARRRGAREQGDRARPPRDREHGRVPPPERLREARDPLARAARGPPRRRETPGLQAPKTPGFRGFAHGRPALPSMPWPSSWWRSTSRRQTATPCGAAGSRLAAPPRR